MLAPRLPRCVVTVRVSTRPEMCEGDQMSDSVTEVAADAELARLIRGGHERAQSAAADVAHRHRDAVVTYAGLLCGERRAVGKLADESFGRTLEAVRSGAGPTENWRPYLLAEVRSAAAGWADTGRRAALSAGFVAWLDALPQPEPAAPSARAAVTAAESDSFLLRAFRSLPESRQAELWHCLEESTGRPPTPRPEPDAPARQLLYDAYLQMYAARVPHRPCRHLVAVLGDFVRHGTGDTRNLDRHLSRCESCSRAGGELTAIDLWQRPVLLQGLLLWAGEPSSTALPVIAASSRQASAAVPRPARLTRARPPHRGGRRPGGRRALACRGAVAAGAMAALAIAGVVLIETMDAAGTHPPLAGTALLPVSAASASLTSPVDVSGAPPVAPSPRTWTVSASATPSPSPSAPPSTAVRTPSASAVPSPSPSAVAAPPSTDKPIGLPLVNRSTGLCVGLTDRSGDGPLQLQQCTGRASQRWERLAVSQNAYQLRNADTGTCLDGTTSGGNDVVVALRSCRSDAARAQQLWRFVPDTEPGTFRLWFVPPVPSSDYSCHLLGPQNWPEADPPRPGSPLVQLPDYYHSESFLFTMK
ncbi:MULTISPECIES: RICIN domain-containing protein [unclassified Kitasatospora]|uniref:RICIN domain-containing protein n=1 Tax=unclassified Kitasatospora TaxID=2633591 RepID=UPI0033C31E84